MKLRTANLSFKLAAILLVTFLVCLVTALQMAVLPAKKAGALNGSEFNAGRIIDDGVFYNYGTMSAAQIQQFLDAKMPNCDTNGTKSYSYYFNPNTGEVNNRNENWDGDVWVTTTRAVYGTRVANYLGESRGSRAPFVCLRNYTQTTSDIAPESGLCNGYSGASNESAATIIFKVAQSCGINPQVLLVTLQKEQSLITDDWPWGLQYAKAMGYNCPDSSLPANEDANGNGCRDWSEGFFMQVYYGAHRFKVYQANPNNYNYKANRNNTILWHPNTGCGSSNVFIENQATAALYIYTPYRPNQAALNNLYGTGDSCSSYGNRNFWRMFRDWFGTTYAGAFHASFVEQSPYPSMRQGQSANAYVKFRNTGNSAWYDDIGAAGTIHKPVRLATDLPLNKMSPLGSSWKYPHRPGVNFAKVYKADGSGLTPNQHVAYPGEVVEFWFAYTAPHSLSPGTYQEGFRMIVEGSGPMNSTGTYFMVEVKPTIYTAAFAGQSGHPTAMQGQSAPVYFKFKNTGNVAWYDNISAWSAKQPPVRLGTDGPLNRSSVFGSSWAGGPTRPVRDFAAVYESDGATLAANQHVVQPGQIAKFAFDFKVPADLAPGHYPEVFRPIVEGVGPMNNTGTWLGVSVQQAKYTAQYMGQSAFPTISRGQSAPAYFKFKNTGNVAWYDNISAWSAGQPPVRLGTDGPLNRVSKFGTNWAGGSTRPVRDFAAVYKSDGVTLAANQHVVQPGQIAKFAFDFKVPANLTPGFYPEVFRPIVEGVGPMNNTGTWLGVTVK